MISHRPRIVVIGAGIIGSAITYNFAIRGADVLLVEEGPKPGSGVTGHSFGWINVINGVTSDISYLLWRQAVAEYRHLKTTLPEAFHSARSGSLLWKATADETEQFADLHLLAGENVELLERRAVAELEPHLRLIPDCAVFSRDDLAFDPAQLAGTFVNTAVAAGALARFGEAVKAIETTNGRVTGIRIANEVIAADVVVMAAGNGIETLATALGIDTGIAISPALLFRYACSRPVINHILCGPLLEIRQAPDYTLLVPKSYVQDGVENGPRLIGERLLTVMKNVLDLPDDTALTSVGIGNRPVFSDDLPRVGFLSEIEGLYVAAGHPGVILAPLIGRLAAQEVLEGRKPELIHGPKQK